MKQQTIIFLLAVGLLFSLACNPRVTDLTKELITQLFPVDIKFDPNSNFQMPEVRRTISGQYLIGPQEGGEIDQIIVMTRSEDGDGTPGSFIIDPEVDSATYNPTLGISTLTDIEANMVLPSILELNDSTFFDTDVVVKGTIADLSDQTTFVTGPANRQVTPGSGTTLVDGDRQFSYMKTLWRYQQDSVYLFLGQPE
ncbi:MAG: hypothetical protein AAFO94_17425 [Bacteroidota bacterium]